MPYRAHLFVLALATLVVAFAAGSPSTAASADDCEAEASELLAEHTTTENDVHHIGAEQVEACGFTVGLSELEDIRFLAEHEGMGLAEALEGYHWQVDFGDAANELRTEFPDRYAGARFEPEGGSWVAFRGAAPAAADEVTGALPIEVVEHRGFSEAELNATLVETFTEISDRPDIDSSAGGYDQVTGEITIQAVPRDDAAAEAILSQDWTAENPAITIEVEILEEPAWEPEAHLWGGGYTNTSGCTASFGVQDFNGNTGLSTAHHCATIQGSSNYHSTDRYQSHGSTSETSIFFRDRASGSYGDIAWYGRSGHAATNTFYYDYSATRSVSQTSAPTEGQTIFNFGRSSGRGFEEVYRLNECVNYSGYPQYCGLTAMSSHITQGGDSGGPWYYGSTAYGIHSGSTSIWWTRRSVFTPVQGNLFNGMNVLVQIN